MGFIKDIFGGGSNDPPAVRALNHPRDLLVGDIVKFDFTAQTGLSGETFRVQSIDTYDLGETKQVTVFILDGNTGQFRLALFKEREKELLELQKAVYPETVGKIFDIEKFAYLFEQDSGVSNVLDRIGEPEDVAGWTAPHYRQEAGHEAYFYAGDQRHRTLSRYVEDNAVAFDYYYLVSDDRKFAIQCEVYDGGRTDVYLIAYLELSKIAEMWPAGQSPAPNQAPP